MKREIQRPSLIPNCIGYCQTLVIVISSLFLWFLIVWSFMCVWRVLHG